MIVGILIAVYVLSTIGFMVAYFLDPAPDTNGVFLLGIFPIVNTVILAIYLICSLVEYIKNRDMRVAGKELDKTKAGLVIKYYQSIEDTDVHYDRDKIRKSILEHGCITRGLYRDIKERMEQETAQRRGQVLLDIMDGKSPMDIAELRQKLDSQGIAHESCS